VLADADVALALFALVVVLGHKILQLELLLPDLILEGECPLGERGLLFFHFPLVKGIPRMGFLCELGNGRGILEVELLPHSLKDLLHGHVRLSLLLQFTL
jgi:hypothetical protein